MVAGVREACAAPTEREGAVGHGNSDQADRDHKAKEDEEVVEVESREREPARTDALGNSRRGGGSIGSGAGGGSAHGLRGPQHGGDPVVGGGGDPAQAPAAPEWAGPALFGDEDWLPDPTALAPPLDLDAWLGDARADADTVMRRLAALDPDGHPQNQAAGVLLTPHDDLFGAHLGAWLRALPAVLAETSSAAVYAWLAETGAGHLDPSERPRSRRRTRQAALGTLALLTCARDRSEPTAELARRLGLTARAELLDQAEQAANRRGPALHRTTELFAEQVGVSPPDPTVLPTTTAHPWWRAQLALRPAAHWRPPTVSAAPVEPLAAFLPRLTQENDRQSGEAVARQGIGLFREVLRSRVRAAAALTALVRSASPEASDELVGLATALAHRHDERTTAVLAYLRQLGRGLSREGWSAATATQTQLAAMDAYDRAIEALLHELGALHDRTFDRSMPDAAPPGALRAALLRGDLRRARTHLPPPQRAEDVLAAAVLDALVPHSTDRWRPVSALQPHLVQAGRYELAALVDTLLAPAAWRDGDAHAAELAAERLRATALAHDLPASHCDATWLLLDLRAARGDDPERLEELLLTAARAARRFGAPGWEFELLHWAPT